MQSDEQLAARMQQGDEDAMAELIERHHSRLIGYLYRMTGGDRALAEDLTQDAFLRVLRAIDSYQPGRPFKAWLYAIATNAARNHYGSADTRRTETVDERYEAASDDPVAHIGEMDAVLGALRGLPDGQREVVVLRYTQDLSLEEIGTALDIPLGTVKSRLSLGLKRLRELMEPTNG